MPVLPAHCSHAWLQTKAISDGKGDQGVFAMKPVEPVEWHDVCVQGGG